MAGKRTLGFSPTALRKKFRAGMTVRNYRDNEVVFSQGDTADAVFYNQSGTVKLTAVSTRRKKAIIAFLQRGTILVSAGGTTPRQRFSRSAEARRNPKACIKSVSPIEYESHPSFRQSFLLNNVKDTLLTFFSRQ